ncbi:unnamed protein product [Mytilus coruscus]|uniref:Uncharacterized protein n=1 Tax=Mytilus coruscus TaxID=42192 RepID=A0A6J8BSS0_MYTCO|nr:unnamed protein product [Mytilus coruscus]
MTTEHTEEISTVSQQQTSLIISSAGIINTEVIIYLSCGVSFFLILGCSMICFYGGKTYQKARINQNVGINQIIDLNNREVDVDSDAEISLNISTERGSGYGYAEIDELEMSEFILIPLEQLHLVHDDSSSDSSDGIRLPSDGYLNPYQSLLPSLQQSGNDQDDSDKYSHLDEENRAYTNLYQSLRYNRPHDLRQYASCTSVQYFKVLDEPIRNETDLNIKEYSKRHRKTW